MPLVLIVIVNWNGKDDILACLASLARQNYPADKFKVVVVDNASSDCSQEAIIRHHPRVLLVQNAKNIGYVRAVNQGITYGLGMKVDYFWVLNNDVVVGEDALVELMRIAQKDAAIGIAAPLVYSFDKPERIEHTGYAINFWTGRLRKLRYGIDIFSDASDEFCDVDSFLGCSNLIKAEVVNKIGLFRPVYGLYFEETDFNVRARRVGFRVVVARSASVRHKVASTMNKHIGRRAYLLLRNLLIFELLNAPLKQLLVFIPYYFIVHVPYFLVRGSVYALKVKLREYRKKGCYAFL